MILIFVADHQSPRLNYILDEILHKRLAIKYAITDNVDYFRHSQMSKINYSDTLMEDCLNIPAALLLYEENIKKQSIHVKPNNHYQYTFFDITIDTSKFIEAPKQIIPFDVFAASFYLLSRYEEYVLETFDIHNRFKAEHSLAYQNNFLQLPLVDHWANELGKTINHYFKHIQFQNNTYKAIHTFDVDFAYKYKGLSTTQFYKKALGNLFRFDFAELQTQFSKDKPDAYDTYQLIYDSIAQYNFETIFFFLLAEVNTSYDKNLLPGSTIYEKLILTIKGKYNIGLHPSYYAGLGANSIAEEKQLLENIVHKSVEQTRFHFLKFRLPKSYTYLINAGFHRDYSMAYSTHIGFRASTCKPFHFFNLTENATTHLQVFSPCVMDVTLKNYLQLSPAEALEKINELQEKVKSVNGIFMSIWHNSNLIDSEGWAGWKDVWLKMVSA